MALSVAEAKTKLQPYILRFMDQEKIKFITDAEFINVLNTVAGDMNKKANINTVRYYKKTIADINYYEMPGDIIKMLLFIYTDSAYQDQWYAITRVAGTPYNSMIVLKETPTDAVQMDIRFLRQTFDVSVDADEIDLPDRYISEFLDLVRIKMRVDFGNENAAIYDSYLDYKCNQIKQVLDPEFGHEGVRSWWPFEGSYADDSIYDITQNRVSNDSIQDNNDGTYTWLE